MTMTQKTYFLSLCLIAVLAVFSSCASTRNAVSITSLDGEWNIIEINESAVVPAPNQDFPFIGFDTREGRVYGNAGCNRMTGSFDVHAKAGRIDLSEMGSTRMACPDMSVEDKVLAALAKVKKYKKLEEGYMALCGSSKRAVVVLKKRN